MAVVTQTEFPVPVFVPYERPPQAQTLWSAIPRGLYSLVIANAVLDAKPVNDDALLVIPATLPRNYAYVFQDMAWSMVQGRASDWHDRCQINLQTFFRGNRDLQMHWMVGSETTGQNNNTRVLVHSDGTGGFKPMPRFPLLDEDGAGVQFTFHAWDNADTVSTAGTFDFYASFWQFDLEQIRKYPINSPLPVQAR